MAVALVAAAAWLSAEQVRADSLSDVYLSGHADVGVAYEDGSLNLHLHIHDGGADANGDPLSGEFAPDGIYIGVPDASKSTLNDATVWTLPGQQEEAGSDMPFLGFGSEDLFDDTATWSNISYQLTNVSGPGDVLLWNVLMSGAKYYWDSSDGLDENDVYSLSGATGHGHAYWTFTDEGVYELEITASGTRDGVLCSDVGTFTFLVGDTAISTVPEPGTIGLLISGAVAMAFGLLRRRRG